MYLVCQAFINQNTPDEYFVFHFLEVVKYLAVFVCLFSSN